MYMCTGIDDCPTCSEPYEEKQLTNKHAVLVCENGHEWIVNDIQNIDEFFPGFAHPV